MSRSTRKAPRRGSRRSCAPPTAACCWQRLRPRRCCASSCRGSRQGCGRIWSGWATRPPSRPTSQARFSEADAAALSGRAAAGRRRRRRSGPPPVHLGIDRHAQGRDRRASQRDRLRDLGERLLRRQRDRSRVLSLAAGLRSLDLGSVRRLRGRRRGPSRAAAAQPVPRPAGRVHPRAPAHPMVLGALAAGLSGALRRRAARATFPI